MKKLIYLIPFLILLTGCASTMNTTQEQENTFSEFGRPLGTHYLDRHARKAQLSAIHHWSAQGNIAIHTDQKGWNASFNWQQNNDGYTLALFGPLGTNRVQLTGNSQQVILQTANRRVSANNAETLIQHELGWNIPISNLYYWLRGLPAPGSKARQSYDMNNHLVQLHQQGWHIIYLRHVSVHGIDLPDRLLLTNQRLQVRVLVTHWTL